MEDLIKLIEKSGFLVSNTDDYYKLEIRDSKNNNELLKRPFFDSNNFSGINGRSVTLVLNYVEIRIGKGLIITKDKSSSNSHRYEIEFKLNDKACKIKVDCKFANAKTTGSVLVEIVTHEYMTEEANLRIDLKPLNSMIYYNNVFCNSVDIEKSTPELYFKTIVDFLNENELVSTYSQLQDALKIILPFISEDIEKIFSSYLENIDRYIKGLENDKAEHQAKIEAIDIDIEILKKISKNKQIIKKQNI